MQTKTNRQAVRPVIYSVDPTADERTQMQQMIAAEDHAEAQWLTHRRLKDMASHRERKPLVEVTS